jgi:hypothetical protein
MSMYKDYPIRERRFYCNTGGLDYSDFDNNGAFSDVYPAVMRARGARFEYGEKG